MKGGRAHLHERTEGEKGRKFKLLRRVREGKKTRLYLNSLYERDAKGKGRKILWLEKKGGEKKTNSHRQGDRGEGGEGNLAAVLEKMAERKKAF